LNSSSKSIVFVEESKTIYIALKLIFIK
jgi:hypothetical protein